MMLSEKIASALQIYESKRGIWRRLFSFLGFGYAPVIKRLRKLDLSEVDELRVLTCFIENMPKESQTSYNVYKDIFSFINIREVTACLKILHQSKLLTKENFNVIKEHNKPSGLDWVLYMLKGAHLLTQENFNAIKEHNNPSGFFRALSRLNVAHLLTQKNFNAIKEHNKLFNLAWALLELNLAHLLTQENFNAIKEHNKLFDLAEALSKLRKDKILTQEYFNAVKEHNSPLDLAKALSELKEAHLLTQEYFNAVKEHNSPLDLAKALSELKEAHLLTQEYFNAVKEHNSPLDLAKALSELKEAHLLTQENFNAVKEHNKLFDLAWALPELKEAHLLTQEYFNAVKEHYYPLDLAKALSELKEAHLLTQEYFNAVKEHNSPLDLAKASSELKEAHLLTQENFNAVKEHNKLFDLAWALPELKEAHLLTQENFNAVKEHNSPLGLAKALSELKEAHLLTQEYFNAVKEHNSPSSLAKALSELKEAHLLTQEYFNAVNKEHNYPLGLAKALSELKEAHLLTQEHFNVVKKEHNYPLGLTKALIALHRVRLFTLENFGRLIHPQNNVLLLLRRERGIWEHIPQHLLTQPVFEDLIRCASLLNPESQIRQYIDLLLGNNNNGAGINNNQSIHTASIHQSVSTSAIKLWARYSAELPENKVKEIITTIKKDISNLSDTLINEAAKSCIERISQSNFVDPYSQVTMKQLLALSYLARHDDANHRGSIEDANKQFIDGLYEVQRGYNLSAEGVDDEQKDRPICTAGMFNKLMEKLSGVHPDVELLFITKEIATQKLPVIVREEVKTYLEKLSKPETKEGFHSFIMLLEQLLKNGIDIIWNKIKPKVADRLFDEFKSIYDNNKENSDFLGLVDAGQYTQIENLGDYQQQIVSSAGYRKYCSQTLRHTRHFFQRSSVFFSQAQSEPIDETWKKAQSATSRSPR